MSNRRDFIHGITAVGIAAGAVTATGNVNDRPDKERNGPRVPALIDLPISRIGYGCAGLSSWSRVPTSSDEVMSSARVIQRAYDSGITLFDHADIYAYGKAEEAFGKALKKSPGLRNKIAIQSKCGQTFVKGGQLGDPIFPDLSRAHIVSSVDGSLSRLGTDRLDILLLHVADALVRPDEVAAAFDELHRAGKVIHFGVSNYNSSQIRLLSTCVLQPIVVNQIQISLSHVAPLMDGMEFAIKIVRARNGGQTTAVAPEAGTIDYCRTNGIQIQASSPLSGVMNPPQNARPELRRVVTLLEGLARDKETTPAAVALAWLLRHPADIVPIVSSRSPQHIVENALAHRVELSSQDWYTLFAAATP